MEPKISREFTAHPDNYTKGGNKPQYIVVHYTAGGSTAWNVAHWKANDANPEHPGSFHFVLDGCGTIYQMMELTDTAWGIGGWKGTTQYIYNNQHISIEVVNDGEPFTINEIAELHWLVRRLMAQFNIDADHVVRHFDCHSGRKECPYYYAGFNNKAWENLHAIITRGEDEMDVNEFLNAPVAYQDPKTGKQMNKKLWELVSWGGHYDSYTATKIAEVQSKTIELSNKVIELEKKMDSQTTLIKNVQKILNTISKKLA